MSEEKAKDKKKKQESVELSLFDLILRDMEIDFELIKTFRGNITALRGYMASIGNMRTREIFRKFFVDTDGVLSQMSNQRTIIISAIKKAKTKCEQQQPITSNPPTTSVESATGKKSIPNDLKTSSAPDATEQEKSPAQKE